MRPFTAQAIGEASRLFEDECKNPETPMHKHPEDYALFQIGTFDQLTGTIKPMEPLCLARAHEVLSLTNQAPTGQ